MTDYAGASPSFGSGPPLAEYDKRLIAGAVDYLAPLVPYILFLFAGAPALAFLLWLAGLGWIIYQKVQEGSTGQSIGKKVAGTKLVLEATGQPVGAGLAVGRYFLHILDGICLIGYLFPLWDPKKQTFADKILKTVVVMA
ncbi:MAG: RDD family protein [Acidimicrobiales bacterium]